jgi:hypothetical protein
MGKCSQGHVQGRARGKDARCEKGLYREIPEWGNAQINKISNTKERLPYILR